MDVGGIHYGFIYSGYNKKDFSGGTFSNITPNVEFTGINDIGQIVGYGLTSSGYEGGFVLTPSGGLFTVSADTVDFNKLTPDQQAAVRAGADLYDGLGGDDVITLPDDGNSKKLGWTANKPFNTNSRAGDNYVILGSPGDHTIVGGLGQETYDYTTGDFANFAGFPFATFTTQTLTGGHTAFQVGGLQNKIILPGSPNDYSTITSIPIGGAWGSTSTTISTSKDNTTLPLVTIKTSEIEDVTFANAITNVVRLKGGNLTEEMAALAGDAYNKPPNGNNFPNDEISRGWHPLSAIELGMNPVGVPSAGNTYTMVDGEYTDKGVVNTENASVMVGLVNGTPTLALSFRGTDLPDPDIVDYDSFYGVLQDKFGPLLSALQSYISQEKIRQILIDGHSLGGALAQAALSENWGVSDGMVKAYTWGSPGAENAQSLANAGKANIENFEHVNDAIPKTGHLPLIPNQKQAGGEILIDSIQVSGLLNLLNAHYMGYPDTTDGAYFSDTVWLIQLASAASGDTYFNNTPLAHDLVDGTPYTSAPVQIMPGNPTFGSQQNPSTGNDDFIIGGSGNDQIHLKAGTVVASGKSGNRIIDGGGGTANALFLPYDQSTFKLTPDGNGGTVVTIANGGKLVATLYNIQTVYFADGTTWPGPAKTAQNILWQNANGQVAAWDMDGTSLTASATVAAPGPSWRTIGTGDFGGGNQSDLLLQNLSGNVAVWAMNGASPIGSAVVANPGPNWRAIGAGDFDAAGQSGILLQNTNGNIAIWDLDGASLKSSAVVANPGPNWHAIGTGDFNNDHHSDILLQNTNGNIAIWEMDGTSLTNSGVVANPGPNWKAVGTGDFNGDSHSDILLQNADGRLAIWEMMGTTMGPDSGIVSANPGPNWHAIGTDGGSDILFQNASGQVAIWNMDGIHIASSGIIAANPGTNWRAVGMS